MKKRISRFVTVFTALAMLVTAFSCNGLVNPPEEKQTAATPVITVADNKVSIACTTEGASIYYTTDGSAPTAESTLYSKPFAITETVTVKAIAVKDGFNNSEAAEKECAYVKPVATKPAITVKDNKVTITTATEGAVIYYTIDGTAPTSASTKYTAPVALTKTVTVKAIAAKDGFTDSEVAEKECAYVKPVAAKPAITDTDNKVTITSATEGAVIYYTIDGTAPTSASTKYTAPFAVTASVTVKAVAVKEGFTDSEVASADVEYVAPGAVGAPRITQNINTVTITCATTGATIYYTTDGTAPTTSSTQYSAPITLTETKTIKAFAVKADCTDSEVTTKECTFVAAVATPVISDVSNNTVTITCATEGASIYYTTDGSAPTAESTEYESVITLTATVTIKAIAIKEGAPNSEVASKECAYTAPVAATPAISDVTDNTVTITCATTGATIYYTTDGSAPTSSSTAYTSAISLTATVTVKAIAVKEGFTNSEVASKECVFTAPPASAVTIVAKDTYTVAVSNAYSQAIVNRTGSDASVTEGDLLIVSGTVSSGTENIGQVYFQVGIGSESIQVGSKWYGGTSTIKEHNLFGVCRVNAAGSISYMQIALQKATGSGVESLAQNTEISLSNFYVMRIPAADLDSLAPGLYIPSAQLEPKETDSNGTPAYGWEKIFSFETAAAATAGKICFVQYTRPEVAQDYKSHYFQFENTDWTAGSNWQAEYPSKAQGVITFCWTVGTDFDWKNTQIGTQSETALPTSNLTITDLTIRLIPTF